MKARWIVAVSVLIGITLSFAKTRMIVEDPNNPVVGRYSVTDEQKQQAVETAEAFLAGGREEATQRAFAIRFIAVDSGPLTPDQQKREASFIEKAQARFARYEVPFDPNQPLHPVVIYDTIRHRVIHGRLYTVTQLPPRYAEGRIDEYDILYVGGGNLGAKSGYYK
jgi:hypothetical protein